MTKTPPDGLCATGTGLWRAILAEYVLDPAELVMLAELCRVADRLDRLAAALADAPLTVPGPTGQQICA